MSTISPTRPNGEEIRLPVEPPQYQEYEIRRAGPPVQWDDSLGGWVITRFDLCEEVEQNDILFARADRPDVNGPEVNQMVRRMNGGPRSLQTIVGSEHARLHGSLGVALTRQARANRKLADELAAERLAAMDGAVEFSSAFADMFPTTIITSVLGLPWVRDQERLDTVRRCTSLIGRAVNGFDYLGEVYKQGADASVELSALLRPEVERLVALEDGNMVAELYRMGREIFDDWTVEDVLVHCRLLYFAGSESSASFLANLIYVLATNPVAWERLEADRSLIPTFVEEVLRVVPPIQGRVRVAAEDTEVDGVPIAKGQMLFLLNAAANREAGRFESPDTVDLDQRPRRHLAFNSGPRTCPGVPTARMEGVALLGALLDQFESVTLDPRKPAPVFVGQLAAGYKPLHVVLTRRIESKSQRSVA